MRRLFCGSAVVLALAACQVQPTVRRVQAPPHRVTDTKLERLGDPASPIDEEATMRFLDVEIERRQREPVITYEPAPSTEPMAVAVPGQVYYQDYYAPAPYQGYRPSRRRFGLGNTLFGAGLGAIIGHQNGRRDKGAAIGAGIGFLLDMARR